VGWIVYDLIPLLTPQYFSLNTEALLRSQRKTAEQADFIVAISENTKKDVVDWLGYPEERVCVVYPGVSQKKSKLVTKNLSAHSRPYVYYLGSLALNKNVDGMLRIFSRCVHKHSLDMDIVLSGRDFCGKSFWDQLIRELDIEGRVHFTGWIPDAERQRFLVNATMLWQFSWYEGFGLPVLEAASCGTPVLHANRGAVPEILQNPEQEIDPSNEREAAARAAAALQSPETLQKWKEWGLHRASEFSWDRSGLKLLNWLETHF
jgi:glycosyltransferase involved in cell wall biosynthesis